MTTHKAVRGSIRRNQKTALAECGKTVKTALIAIGDDCTCTDCRERVDADLRAMQELAERLGATGLTMTRAEAARRAADPKRYQTIYFL